MGQQRCRGAGIGKRVVRVRMVDAVAIAQVDEAVRVDPIVVEGAGQSQRAQAPSVGRGVAGAPKAATQERPIEVGVVRGEHRAVEPIYELGYEAGDGRCAAQPAHREAVDVRWPDAPQARPNVARPLVQDRAVGASLDDGDLQDAVTARRQPAGLDVDHGETLLVQRGTGRVLAHDGHATPPV